MWHNILADWKKNVPTFSPSMVLDVGANVGQSASEFADAFPQATVHSFEPVASTYARLVEAVKHRPNVICHRLALSHYNGVGLVTNTTNRTNRLVIKDKHGNTETV